jgi:pyrroline-5-carboxylate reductase
MAQAIIGGLIARGESANQLSAIEPNEPARASLTQTGVVNSPNFREDSLDCEVIVLAVKPQVMREALAPLAGKLKGQLVISIAAGVRCEDIAAWLGSPGAPYANVARAMPNTPALIHAGITGLYASTGVTDLGRAQAEELLGAVGKTAWFGEEDMLNAVTAVSGSGPAYVFYFIEALESAALELGFSGAAARTFAIETFLGGARLAAHSADSPAELRRKVTSRRGTTECALDTFGRHALGEKFVEGVKAARERSRELGDELGGKGAGGGAGS